MIFIPRRMKSLSNYNNPPLIWINERDVWQSSLGMIEGGNIPPQPMKSFEFSTNDDGSTRKKTKEEGMN